MMTNGKVIRYQRHICPIKKNENSYLSAMNLSKWASAFLFLLISAAAGAQDIHLKQFKNLSDRAGAFMRGGKPDSMVILSKKMLGIAQQLRNDSLLAESYVNFGDAFMLKNDFENALTYLYKGLHIAEASDQADPAIRALINIATVYEDMENYAEARKSIRRALVYLPRSKRQTTIEVYLTGNLAFVESAGGRKDSARKYIALSQAAYQKDKKQHGVDHYVESFQMLLEAMTDPSDSTFRKAADYSQKYAITYVRTGVLTGYAKFLLAKGEFRRAGQLSREAFSTATKAGFATEAIASAGALSTVYDRLHQVDSANYYYRLKDSLQQKVYDRQRLNRLQDLSFTEQIRAQEEEAKAAELEVERRNNLQYAGIAVVIISLAVVYLRRSRKAAKRAGLTEFLGVVALLIFFEFVNLLLHPLLGRFTHESPLLMLLLMVVIAALLVPLHHRMESLVKRKAGKEHH